MELKVSSLLILPISLIFVDVDCHPFCGEEVRLKFTGPITNHINGSASHDNLTYPNGTFWKEGDEHYGCPCQLKNCLRICKKKHAEMKNLKLPLEDVKINILLENEAAISVKLHDHFYALKEVVCDPSFVFEHISTPYNITKNGMLHFYDEEDLSLPAESFCVAASKESNEPHVIYCKNAGLSVTTPESMAHSEIQMHVYTILMIVSICFLFLVLVVFFISPEMHNLHGKSIACQSGTLMLGFIGLSGANLSGIPPINQTVCKLSAYMTHMFILSSFFWLQTMCFDMFWTFGDFKKMSSSLNHAQRKKFQLYACYSTIIPLILSGIMISLNTVLDDSSALWPGIGKEHCWLRDHNTQLLYFHGPVFILLIVNVIFFAWTLLKILSMKKASKVLKRGDSMTHRAGRSGVKDKQRLSLYLKLFVLMGGTWIMESLSLIFDNEPKWFWFACDIVNCSRGVFIFILCVVLNEKVRNSLLKRIGKKSSSRQDSTRESKASRTTSSVSQMEMTTIDL